MIERTADVSATTRTADTGGRAAPAAPARGDFAAELSRMTTAETKKSKAAARPDGEKTEKVDGHPYAKVLNGEDKGLYLNQLQSSPRSGSVFRLVERDERTFHIYGTGREKVVVEVKAKADAADDSAAAKPTGGATADKS